MNNRNWLNLALLLLVGALVLLVIYQPGQDSAENQMKVLTGLTDQEVKRIRIESAGQAPITLERRGQDWWLTAPRELRVSEFKVANILKLTGTKSHAHYPVATMNLALIKLEPPLARLWLNEREIAFGDLNPLAYQRYLKTDDQVHLITDSLFHHISGAYTEFVSTELLPPQSSIERIVLPDTTLAMADGKWQLTPAREQVSADSLQALADEWRHVRALEVQDADPASHPVPKQSVEIFLRGSAAPIHFDILATDPELILRNPELGLQYHLSSGSYARLITLAASPEPADQAR
ncbi:MAG: hypothetical protein A2V90_04355 [Gammaproteobacteria bacterium RBG_16_57_12]|nr:MAG: hypothetical protein A2V90_04355 [Gammaproteobacteria bacterium RBG_16_57_12]